MFDDWNAGANGIQGADLAIIDLQSGTRRVLDKHPATGSYVEGDAVFSPDGTQVAYHFVEIPGFNHQIRIVPVSGGTPRIVYQSKNSNSQYVFIKGWTPDGRRLLISPELHDLTWQLVMLSIAEGTLQTIKSFSWTQVHADLSPDGRYIAYAVPVRDDDVTRDIFVLTVDGSQEIPLVQHPANDSDPIWSADGSHVLFVSNRTRSSSLWAVPVKAGRPAGEAVLVKDDVPMGRPLGPQQPKTMTRSGALFYTVARRQTNVYHVPLGTDGKAAGDPKIATNHDLNNDCCATVSPDGKRLAYYSRSPTLLVIRDLSTGGEQEHQLSLEINPLLATAPAWFPDGRSVLVNGSVPQQGGNHQYRVDLTTGRAEAVSVKAISVHSRLSPEGKAIVQGGDRLQWHDLVSRDVTVIKAEPKVAYFSPTFSPDGKQIAYWQWRAGASGVSNIVVAQSSGSEPQVVCACKLAGGNSPHNVLTWTPDQRHLLYADNGTLWRVPVTGGEPERMGVSMGGRIQGPQVQPDGRGLYFTLRGAPIPAELWMLQNFLSGPTAK